MKVNLTRPSEATIVFNIAVKLQTDCIGVCMDYYVRDTECRNARFDIVLYDKKTFDMLAVIEVEQSSFYNVELVSEANPECHTAKTKKYYNFLKKYNVPLIIAHTSFEKAISARNEIQRILTKIWD